ncbi:unnamed protein product [Spodoptera littoralis]|uniref:E3 ubiquitin-protein ligase listerin n=1 Tax=Spodoptera littoralis TaxID=7109 RepID=A0A9P0N6J5_SPOLI|nr:unnamed protein product [Spodoptera littoralis]CAH1646885.1 unnamed protein product [Spodoptera littoralis]
MGGKSKQSQRTKNNAKPSSSSRSAELLNNGINLDASVITLGSGKSLPPLFPTLATANLEQGLNPEFQICFKKLTKKDPVTRAKALQDLCELVNNGDVEDVVAALPSWAHYYRILTTDIDRKACHGAVLAASGRRAAPQLRALVPAWLQAQHDDHAPAQSHARRALAKTFPDTKLPEVISFCKAEVIAYLLDNLIGNTGAVISKRIQNEEERELQMNRIITSSLHGLQYFLVHLPSAHDDWLWTELEPLLQAPAFWKLFHGPPQSMIKKWINKVKHVRSARHVSPEVVAVSAAQCCRAAWCGCAGRLAARGARLGAERGSRLGAERARRLLRLLLQRAPPPAAADTWAALLQLMHHVPEWHAYLDEKDLLVRRLLDMLENGGWGDARQLSNTLLPLLAHLPQDLVTKDFYEAFFNAIFSGLEKKNVLNSKSERQLWITSLSECLRYLSIQQYDYVLEITTNVHRTWLARVLSTTQDAQTRSNLIKYSAGCMTSLVKYWLRQSNEQKSEKYDQLVRNFWQNIGSTVSAQIDKSGNDVNEISQLIEGHILLLQTLKTSFSQEGKKQLNIKFDDDEPSVPEESVAAFSSAPAGAADAADAADAERYRHCLWRQAEAAAAAYLGAGAARRLAPAVLAPLITLLVAFDSEAVFLALARQLGQPSVAALYHNVLRGWLCEDDMRCEALVDVIFLMTEYMTEREQDAMFDTFQQLAPDAVEWCVSACLRHPMVGRPAARRWLGGPGVGAALRALAARAVRPAPDPRAAALLLACVADAPTGELLVSESSVSEVVDIVGGALEAAAGGALEAVGGASETAGGALEAAGGASEAAGGALEAAGEALEAAGQALEAAGEALESCAMLCARLATAQPRRAARLALPLLRLNARLPWHSGCSSVVSQLGGGRLSSGTWHEVRSSWQDCVAALAPRDLAPFLHGAAQALYDLLYISNSRVLDTTEIENVLCLCPYLFERCDEGDEPVDVAAVVQFTRDLFRAAAPPAAPRPRLQYCALRYLAITAQLNCIFDDDEIMAAIIKDAHATDVKDICKEDFLSYANEILLRAIYLRIMFSHKMSSPDDDDASTDRSRCDVLLADDYLLGEFCEVMYDYAVIETLHEAYAFWPHYELLRRAWEALRGALQAALGAAGPAALQRAARALAQRALEVGYLWALAQRALHRLEPGLQPGALDCAAQDLMSGNGFFHSLQVQASADEALRVRLLVALRSWSAATGAAPLEPAPAAERDLDLFVAAYYAQPSSMLFDRNVSECSWADVANNAAVLELMAATVEARGWQASAAAWDFVNIALCSLLGTARRSLAAWGSSALAALLVPALRLLRAAAAFVRDLAPRCQRQEPAPHVAGLAREWPDIFAPDVNYHVFSIVLHALECCEGPMTSPQVEVVGELVRCAPLLQWDALAPEHRAPAAPLALERLARAAAAALGAAAPPPRLALARALLASLARPLVLADAERLAAREAAPAHDAAVLCLDYLHAAFVAAHDLLDSALGSVVVGEGTCELVPGTDSYCVALGWLLLVDAQAELCSLARGDLVAHYVVWYRERQYAELVLRAALRLLPGAHGPAGRRAAAGAGVPARAALGVRAAARGALVGSLACRALYTLLTGPGAAGARGWWGAAPARAARLLERVVVQFVAPEAARQQLRELAAHAAELADTAVEISWGAREVRAVYCVDERRVELRARLAAAHPLAAPRLEAGGPGAGAWLQLYVAQQGSVLGAVRLWAGAVGARVEAAPQCYICYCRLHPSSGRLPRVPCHQCKNKFHNLCLVRPRAAVSLVSNDAPSNTVLDFLPAQVVRHEQQIQLPAMQSGVLMSWPPAAGRDVAVCDDLCIYPYIL